MNHTKKQVRKEVLAMNKDRLIEEKQELKLLLQKARIQSYRGINPYGWALQTEKIDVKLVKYKISQIEKCISKLNQ